MVATSTNNAIEIRCDKCGTKAPPASEILAGHGLINMGWKCSGGTHICPDHKEKK